MLGYLVRVFYDYSSPTRASLGLGTYALRPQRDIAHGERASCASLGSDAALFAASVGSACAFVIPCGPNGAHGGEPTGGWAALDAADGVGRPMGNPPNGFG